jgi:hypothetical protein
LNCLALLPILITHGRRLGRGKKGRDWKKLLGSITASVDEELGLRNAYLLAENRVIRQQIIGRVQRTDSDRKALAEPGQQLDKQALEEMATVAKPDTILAWHRTFADQKGDSSPPHKSGGRRCIDKEIEDLVVRMARDNRSWGYDRIVGALANLGYTVSDQTVGNILKRHGIPPAPERMKTVTWRESIRIHMAMFGATAFFSSEMWAELGFVISSVFFCIRLDHWMIHDVRIMATLYARWMLLIPSPFPDGYPAVERWAHSLMEPGLARLLQWGIPVHQRLLSTFLSHDHHERLPHDRGKVVRWPRGTHRPIRAGPMRCHQRRSRLQPVYEREAA